MHKYFYCRSYPAFLYALWLNKQAEVIIITGSTDIIKACVFLKQKYLAMEPIDRSMMFRNKNGIKKEIDRILGIIGNANLLFSHREFDMICFYLVSEHLKAGGKLVLYDFEISSPKIKMPIISAQYAVKLIQKCKLYFNYNLNLDLRFQNRKQILFGLSDSFFKSKNIEVINIREKYNDYVQDLIESIDFEFAKLRNLFATQYLSDSNTFKQEKVVELFTFLEIKKIPIKTHPNDLIIPANSSNLPQYIPVEFFFKKVSNSVISIYSQCLIAASRFNNIKSISLLDMDFLIDMEFAESMKKLLTDRSNGKILFPKNYTELEELLER